MTDEIRDFIIQNFCFGRDPGLKDDSSFLELGIIDSTGVLELVASLENAYGISIDDVELIPENLDSVCNLHKYLETKLPAPEPIELLGAKGTEDR